MSNIFCLPSDSEGFSTSLLEAAACNNYIITTARGGAKELLPDDSYGLVIEHNDIDSVYNALNEALDNRKKREIGISKTYKRVENNFTWKHTADKVIQLAQANGDN
jgi:glycosyltransferase involved in cell wall biosynthesis